MIRCNYCSKGFAVTPNGMVEKTMHEVLHEPRLVNG